MNNENSKHKKKIKEYLDLSIAELIILQLLSRYQMPFVRYSLYLELNQFIQNSDEKAISVSSFYNSLKNLEKRGIIKSNIRNDGKARTIEPNQRTKSIVEMIMQNLLKISTINIYDFQYEILEKILDKIGLNHFNTLLTTFFFEYIDLRLFHEYVKIADEVSILTKNETYDVLIKMGLEGIRKASIYNGIIREPNDFFDIIILPFYFYNPDFLEMKKINILKESIRVTKKNGIIILTAMSPLPKTQNFFADELIRLYNEFNAYKEITQEEMSNDMIEAGFTKIDIFNHRGILIGIGWTK